VRSGAPTSTHLLGQASMTGRQRADTPLTAVLHGKPIDDEIPAATWWLLAEALRHSVIVRRAVEGVAILSVDEFLYAAGQARLASRAALDELCDPSRALSAQHHRRKVGERSQKAPAIRSTIYDLARLIVSPRPTASEVLRAAILRHLDALEIRPPASAHRPWLQPKAHATTCPYSEGPPHAHENHSHL
jgi:hypothetical protein